jgi:hypothetical protein
MIALSGRFGETVPPGSGVPPAADDSPAGQAKPYCDCGDGLAQAKDATYARNAARYDSRGRAVRTRAWRADRLGHRHRHRSLHLHADPAHHGGPAWSLQIQRGSHRFGQFRWISRRCASRLPHRFAGDAALLAAHRFGWKCRDDRGDGICPSNVGFHHPALPGGRRQRPCADLCLRPVVGVDGAQGAHRPQRGAIRGRWRWNRGIGRVGLGAERGRTRLARPSPRRR